MKKKYRCLIKNEYTYKNYSLATIQENEIEKIRIWRNKNIKILRQTKKIEKKQQVLYFQKNIWPDMKIKQPKNILLSFKKNNVLIGYGGFVHISWENKRSEISFIMGDIDENDDTYKQKFKIFFILLKKIAFKDLSFKKIYVETFIHRKRHIKILELFGFKKEGKLKKHYYFNNLYVDSVLHSYIK